jgi:two-component system cell cycle sensor histidine kinase/response regulator CckA
LGDDTKIQMPSTSSQLLFAALETLGEAVAILSAEGRIAFANASARSLLGLPRSCVAWPEEAGLRVAGGAVAHEVALAGGVVEELVTLPDGRRARCCARPLEDPGGQRIGAIVTLRDVSDEERVNVELKRTATFLDSIVENIPDMIFVKEASELRFERFNRAGEELLGLDRAELLGRNDYDFFPKEQADFFQARDRETLTAGALVDILEEPIDTRHGRRWLHTKKIPILDDAGRPLYLLGISQDVTERKEATEALRRANEELETRVTEAVEALRRTEEQLLHAQKMEAIGRVAGGVAHDFNNMLTVIRSYTELQLRGRGDTKNNLEQIARATDRAAQLTRQLLAFSRQQVLDPRVIDPVEVVRDMVGMLQRLVGEDVTVKTDLPAVGLINADRAQLEQVIVNLAVNARDAMPSGGTLHIGTRREAHEPPPDRVVIAVRDTGTGMTPEVQARAFEPFFTTKERGRGTGLGLSTAYGIVRQSGGDMRIRSAPGEGTTLEIHLPRVDGDLEPAPSVRAERPVAGGTATLLLVEDELLVRQTARMVLEDAGYRVLEASDVFDALRIARDPAHRVDLMLSDVVMPGMSGPRLAELVREVRPELRVLLMSGYTGDEPVRHGATGVELLHKPFSPDELLLAVRNALAD